MAMVARVDMKMVVVWRSRAQTGLGTRGGAR